MLMLIGLGLLEHLIFNIHSHTSSTCSDLKCQYILVQLVQIIPPWQNKKPIQFSSPLMPVSFYFHRVCSHGKGITFHWPDQLRTSCKISVIISWKNIFLYLIYDLPADYFSTWNTCFTVNAYCSDVLNVLKKWLVQMVQHFWRRVKNQE